MAVVEVMRAYRYALDATPAQVEAFVRHAGAARWAYNHALAAKVEAHEQWRARVAELVDAGVGEAAARHQVKVPIPSKPAIQKALNAVKGDSRTGVDGVCPWWWAVSTYAFQSAFADADRAWGNWLSSVKGERAGRRVGYPRFKSKRRARAAFRLHHNVKRPTIRLSTYRRLQLPRIGEVRLHQSAKQLARRVADGIAVIQSVTVSRGGHRWYASVLVREQLAIPDRPTRAQAAAGTVGVDIGVHHLAALSTGETIPNPRTKARHERALTRAARTYARTQRGSGRRERARRRLARLQHLEATRRAGVLHALTKRLATGWTVVAVEDLNVAGMTRSARGNVDAPGRNVRAKAGLNRAVLDVAPGELRRQLTYKTTWYGSQLAVLDRWWPSSKTCSACGAAKTKLRLAERTFHCETCGHTAARDVNAARNIARHAVPLAPAEPTSAVAPSTGETKTAHRAGMRPIRPRPETQPATTREGRPPGRSPHGSNAVAIPASA